MTTTLPPWVYDVVMRLQRWEAEHPRLYAQYAGSDEYQRVDDCGCAALALVPEDVRQQAATIATYLRAACTCPDIDTGTLSQEPGTRTTAKGRNPACPLHGEGPTTT